MIDSTDEQTSPLVAQAADAGAASAGEAATGIFDAPTVLGQVALRKAVVARDASASSTAPMRTLKALDATPIEWSGDAIEFDIRGRGKSKLPTTRIQAIAIAAVAGLSSRPVLVVDLILNWSGPVSEPLKLFRLRSDRFDPLRLEPGESKPLSALTRWIATLQQRSDATCLPSRALLNGEFARFDSLRDYEREVLIAVCRDER
jgi:hypothetical protein